MISILFASVFLLAAGNAVDPVPEGYASWENVDQKHHLRGRQLCPSDLRHRAVIVAVMEYNNDLQKQLAACAPLVNLAMMPASHATQWEEQVFPRNFLMVVSLRGKGGEEALKAAFKTDDDALKKDLQSYSANMISFYNDLRMTGEPEIGGKYPFVYVMGPSGAEPLWKGQCEKVPAALRGAFSKAKREAEAWTPLTGIEETEFFQPLFKQIEAAKKKGGGLAAVLKKARSGIKSSKPEQAVEALKIADAIEQYRSDLACRIAMEFSSAPARAYYDYMQFVKLFPSEKKSLASIEAKLKANKTASKLGQCFEQLMLWNDDNFQCKNAGEAKKIVAELKKWKALLDKIGNDQSIPATISGEAMLFSSQIDGLIETIPTKVPQK